MHICNYLYALYYEIHFSITRALACFVNHKYHSTLQYYDSPMETKDISLMLLLLQLYFIKQTCKYGKCV